jgi:hypothetical protein
LRPMAAHESEKPDASRQNGVLVMCATHLHPPGFPRIPAIITRGGRKTALHQLRVVVNRRA